MRKEKTAWMRHAEQWAKSDPAQAGRLRDIFAFFLLLCFMGLIARGTAGASMPVVTAAVPVRGSVSRAFTLSGEITGGAGEPFLLPAGLMVERVYVQAGDSLAEGDAIAAFLPDSVADALNLQEAQLNVLRAQAERLLTPETADDFALRQAQNRAEQAGQSYEHLRQTCEAAIAQARQRCETAAGTLEEVKHRQPEDPAMAEVWQQELAQAQASWEQAQTDLQDAQTQSRVQLETAAAQLETERSALESARHQYDTEQARLAAAAAENRESAAVLLVQIEQQERTLEHLRQIRQQGDKLVAPVGGMLIQCALTAGQPSGEVGGLIAPQEETLRLTVPLTAQQAQALHTGDLVTVRQGQNSRQMPVTALRPGEDAAAFTLEIELPGAEWQRGPAWVDYAVQSESAGYCVPLDAVGADSGGNFVWLIEEKNTVLGIENVLVRLPVTVTAWGDAAVQIDGALDENSRIATQSTKPLSAGARVRIRV